MRTAMGMRVDCFIAGAQKAGTTALANMLRAHPGIELPTVKEAHFFDDESVKWNAPDYAGLHRHYDSSRAALRCDATPIYIYWPGALERLRAYNPSAKIVVGLRHPAFRAYSHWRMETARDGERLSFSEAIRSGRARVRCAPGGVHRVFSYVERGWYDEQMARLAALFPVPQIFFYRTDELYAAPASVLGRLQAFLGVARALVASERHVSPVAYSETAPMSGEDRALLDAEFSPRYARVEALTGLDLTDWRDPAYLEPMSAHPDHT